MESIEENGLDAEINVYPNPYENSITIVLNDSEELVNAIFYTLNGNRILTSIKNTIETTNISSRVYFLRVQTKKGIFNKKVVKK